MANLLRRDGRAEPFPPLDVEQRRRFRRRLRSLLALASRAGGPPPGSFERWLGEAFDAMQGPLSGPLDEIESDDGSPAMLEAVVETIDRARTEAGGHAASDGGTTGTAAPASAGALLAWWPGRSLETGESEVASRGLFDIRDRPPPVGWLLAVARREAARRDAFERMVVAWIPASEIERAEAGCRVCATAAVEWLEACAPELARPLYAELRSFDA